MKYNGESEFAKLIGKGVKGLYLDDSKTHLGFELADGSRLMFECEGDCCSSSWIEHVNGVSTLVGHNVASAEDRDMPAGDWPEGEDRGDYIQYYGWSLNTEAGSFQIEMRNSSNGYYGGSLEERNGWDDSMALVTEDF